MAQKLLVTGASGKLGRLVLDALLKRGVAASDIIATTRDAAKLADYAAKGIEVREADFNDPPSVTKAFAGADRVAIISTDALDGNGTRIRQQTGAVAAAREAGVKHLVYTSMPNPHEGSKITFEADHRLTEDAVMASGLSYTILRNSWYQENLFMNLPQVLASESQADARATARSVSWRGPYRPPPRLPSDWTPHRLLAGGLNRRHVLTATLRHQIPCDTS